MNSVVSFFSFNKLEEIKTHKDLFPSLQKSDKIYCKYRNHINRKNCQPFWSLLNTDLDYDFYWKKRKNWITKDF